MSRMRFGLGIARKPIRATGLLGLLLVLVLTIGACGQSEEPVTAPPAEEPAAEEPAATEPPAEEPAAEEPAAEEPAATEEPAEEAAPTEEPAEEAVATEAPTEEPTEEPAAEATAAPTEEPAEEAAATPEAAEEGAAEGATGDAASGEYIVTLSGGCGCHFNRDLGGLAGGNDFEGDFGVVYARNITPDPDTGIGNWSEDEIVNAIRLGQRPDGSQLHPIMPYARFSVLSDVEAHAVAAYLLSLEPIANEVPARELASEPAPFTPASEPGAEPPTDPVARGEQLVTVAHCSGCHTPTNEDGTPNMDLFLAGAPLGDDEISANITPHEELGIGAWTEEEIANFLRTGVKPDGSEADGSMAQAIDRRFSVLTEEDALAIAAYLKSIPAVEHDPYTQ
ncbi:MAG TPA: cytochrome c [Caldilineaceae bacterium]|nr:cytochrome c [Caldilineaceae bacterium]